MLHAHNASFASLGATHFHDSLYPERKVWWGYRDYASTIFSRHYFNAEGTEIGLVIPDLLEVGSGVQVFDKPRVWGIPHTLRPLLEAI